MTGFQKKLLTGLLIMTLLTPLGFLLPRMLGSGGAWGEWDTAAIEKIWGYVPEGMKEIADLWKAPVPDYSLGGNESSSELQIISYIISAVLGIAIVAAVVYLLSRFLIKHEK